METNDYCSYELALKLKACGFDELCIAQWACEPDGKPMLVGSTAFVFSNTQLKGRDVTAPLLFHAQKWLREKKGYIISVEPYFSRYVDEILYIGRLYSAEERGEVYSCSGDCTYEKAIEMCIKEALQLLDNENK